MGRSRFFVFGLFFWPCHAAYRILVPQTKIEPMSPALEYRVLTRLSEVTKSLLLLFYESNKSQKPAQFQRRGNIDSTAFWKEYPSPIISRTCRSGDLALEIQPVHSKGHQSFQYFGHLMQRVDSLEKTLMLGGIEGRRRRGQQRMT